MKSAVLLCILAVAAAAPLLQENEYVSLFTSWLKEHKGEGFRYDTMEEELKRFAIWRTNMDYIVTHNTQGKSWTLKMNQFGDLTNFEFASMYNTLKPENTPFRTFPLADLNVESLPSSVNWVAKGKVTAVKNQGQCGSCWAFSTTGSTEAAEAIAHNKLVSLSEQELVDCAGSTGNQGCNGGLMTAAMQWIMQQPTGICTEASYPYTAADGSCKKSHCTASGTRIKNFYAIPFTEGETNETGLQAAVAQQPTSVAVDASGSDWQFYGGGVVDDPNCYNQLDHGVLAAGYGNDAATGKDYWLVKNSWGTSWGNSGYIMLKRNANLDGGECGITRMAAYPIVV